MNNETQSSNTAETKPAPFGARLKTAREALGLERKDAAAQLRLNEKIIIMMEKGRYSADLPVTFIRGYLRAYGKLLEIPEHEINQSIELINPKPAAGYILPPTLSQSHMTSGNYFMQFFTSVIVLTLVGLVGMWWYSHSTVPNTELAALNTPSALTPEPITMAQSAPIVVTPPLSSSPVVSPPIEAAANPLAQTKIAENTENSEIITQKINPQTTVKPILPKNSTRVAKTKAKHAIPVEEAVSSYDADKGEVDTY